MSVNNAKFGLTLQKAICEKYKIVPNSKYAIKQFIAAYDKTYDMQVKEIIKTIFKKIKLKPIECTTFEKGDDKKVIPYNFILSDNSTLSIRTNKKSKKVAPRIVGQAGFEKINEYFGEIYGKPIKTQEDIKDVMYNNIEKCLPIFFEHLFDADYIVWLYTKKDEIKFEILKGNLILDIEFEKDNFSFTRKFEEWTESVSVKYLGKTIAEMQIHKNRTFKFRFNMTNVITLLKKKEKNNETLGVTAEKTICDIFNLSYPDSFFERYSEEMEYQLRDTIVYAFQELPDAIKYCGNEKGEEGGTSKSPYDFILKGDKSLSLKTNTGKMICPPEVGQPGAKTAYMKFKHLITEDHMDKTIFKKMVFEKIDELIPIYLKHLFDSDYLLRIYENKKAPKWTAYDFDIFEKGFGSDVKWDKTRFSFRKPTIEEWNESNIVYYDGVSIGEFQVHNNRVCFKFRFNIESLKSIVISQKNNQKIQQ